MALHDTPSLQCVVSSTDSWPATTLDQLSLVQPLTHFLWREHASHVLNEQICSERKQTQIIIMHDRTTNLLGRFAGNRSLWVESYVMQSSQVLMRKWVEWLFRARQADQESPISESLGWFQVSKYRTLVRSENCYTRSLLISTLTGVFGVFRCFLRCV